MHVLRTEWVRRSVEGENETDGRIEYLLVLNTLDMLRALGGNLVVLLLILTLPMTMLAT